MNCFGFATVIFEGDCTSCYSWP